MVNLHPPFSSFPVALVIITAFLEVWFLLRPRQELQFASAITLAASLLAVVVAFITGYWASETASQTFEIPPETIELHHLFGKLLLFAMVPCVGLKFVLQRARFHIPWFRGMYLGLLLVNVALVILSGYYGGELVFRYGAGVTATHEK